TSATRALSACSRSSSAPCGASAADPVALGRQGSSLRDATVAWRTGPGPPRQFPHGTEQTSGDGAPHPTSGVRWAARPIRCCAAAACTLPQVRTRTNEFKALADGHATGLDSVQPPLCYWSKLGHVGAAKPAHCWPTLGAGALRPDQGGFHAVETGGGGTSRRAGAGRCAGERRPGAAARPRRLGAAGREERRLPG